MVESESRVKNLPSDQFTFGSEIFYSDLDQNPKTAKGNARPNDKVAACYVIASEYIAAM